MKIRPHQLVPLELSNKGHASFVVPFTVSNMAVMSTSEGTQGCTGCYLEKKLDADSELCHVHCELPGTDPSLVESNDLAIADYGSGDSPSEQPHRPHGHAPGVPHLEVI